MPIVKKNQLPRNNFTDFSELFVYPLLWAFIKSLTTIKLVIMMLINHLLIICLSDSGCSFPPTMKKKCRFTVVLISRSSSSY